MKFAKLVISILLVVVIVLVGIFFYGWDYCSEKNRPVSIKSGNVEEYGMSGWTYICEISGQNLLQIGFSRLF